MATYVYDAVNDKLNLVAGGTLYAASPVGSIIAFAGKEINLPEGYLAFNGQTVKRGDYPDLWAFAVANEQVGVDKFFSQGDGSTTFTLADLRETSLKGYGETSRSVGAHVKSGGLGVGEFIDDQLQDHTHYGNYGSSGSDVVGAVPTAGTQYNAAIGITNVRGARTGATTEVKAVGVVWAVKAKQTGLPIDLKAEVEKMMNESITKVHYPWNATGNTDTPTITIAVPAGKCFSGTFYFHNSNAQVSYITAYSEQIQDGHQIARVIGNNGSLSLSTTYVNGTNAPVNIYIQAKYSSVSQNAYCYNYTLN